MAAKRVFHTLLSAFMAAALFCTGASAQMATEGSFRVSEQGSASFSIPIDLPPGAGGVKPTLSFEYDGSRSKGPLGMGWSLGGMSSVERCSRTARTDGINGTVNLDDNDRFCLDGQRLIMVSGSFYGADGAEYRTEFETFQRIRSYKAVYTTGPDRFDVVTKDGLTKSYSVKVLGSPQTSPPTAISWHLWRVTDRFGNYYTYEYDTSSSPGVALVTKVTYTQNTVRTDITVPPIAVVFDYVAMPDRETYAIGPAVVKLNHRLSQVRVLNNTTGALLLYYPVTYGTVGGAGHRSVIAEIKKCGADGQCLLPRNFEYTTSTMLTASKRGVSGTAAYGATGNEFADVFGTGRKVYVSFDNTSGTHRVSMLGQGELRPLITYQMAAMVGTVTNPPTCPTCVINVAPPSTTQESSSFTAVGVTDGADAAVAAGTNVGAVATTDGVIPTGGSNWKFVNAYGDGRELLWFRTSDNKHYIVQYMPDGTFVQKLHTGAHAPLASGWEWGDFFGDGWPVLWSHDTSGNHKITRFNPNGTVQNWSFMGHGIGTNGWMVGNLFGTGQIVYWTRSNTTHYISKLNSNGTIQNFTVGGHGTGSSGSGIVGDVFGDRRDVYWTANGGTHYFTRFKEDGTTQSWQLGGHGVGTDGFGFADVYGDGRKIYWTRSGTTMHLSRFNIDGTVDNWMHATPYGLGSSGQWDWVDALGDGTRVFWTADSSGVHYFSQFQKNGSYYSWSVGGAQATTLGDKGYRWADVLGKGNQQLVSIRTLTSTTTTTDIMDPVVAAPDMLKAATISGYSPITITQGPVARDIYNLTYTRGPLASYPVNNIPSARHVVSSVVVSAGGQTNITDYYYTGEAFDFRYGGLGFAQIESRDRNTGVNATRQFRQDWPMVGMLSRASLGTGSWSSGLGANLVDETKSFAGTYTSAGVTTAVADGGTFPVVANATYLIYEAKAVRKVKDLDGSWLPTEQITTRRDVYGNALENTRALLDASGVSLGYTHSVTNEIADIDLANWRLGNVKRTVTTRSAP